MKYNSSYIERNIFRTLYDMSLKILLAFTVLVLLVFCAPLLFGCKTYRVMSNSQAPLFTDKDFIVVQAKKDYKVEDVIAFDYNSGSVKVTHRIIGIKSHNGKIIYVCHGDAERSFDLSVEGHRGWKEEIEAMSTLSYSELIDKSKYDYLQFVEKEDIRGTVIAKIENANYYYVFVMRYIVIFTFASLSIFEALYLLAFEQDARNKYRITTKF